MKENPRKNIQENIRKKICKRILERKSAKEYSEENPRKNLWAKNRENSLEKIICETILKENPQIPYSIFLRGFSFEYFLGISVEYSFAEFLSNILLLLFLLNMVMRDHVKKSVDGSAFWRNCYSKEIFAQTFFMDFLSNTLSRIFFPIFFRGFSFQYYFSDFLSNIPLKIFFQI